MFTSMSTNGQILSFFLAFLVIIKQESVSVAAQGMGVVPQELFDFINRQVRPANTAVQSNFSTVKVPSSSTSVHPGRITITPANSNLGPIDGFAPDSFGPASNSNSDLLIGLKNFMNPASVPSPRSPRPVQPNQPARMVQPQLIINKVSSPIPSPVSFPSISAFMPSKDPIQPLPPSFPKSTMPTQQSQPSQSISPPPLLPVAPSISILPRTNEGTIDFVPPEHNRLNQLINNPWANSNNQQTSISRPNPSMPQNRRSYVNNMIDRPSTLQPNGSPSPTANMILPPEIQRQALSMGRQMGVIQHYEAHGCVDPTASLPPGSVSMGLMFSCSSQDSQQMCSDAAIRLGYGGPNLNFMSMFQPPAYTALLETCLTRSAMQNVIMESMRGGLNRGSTGSTSGMDPAMLLMLAGGSSSMLSSLALMNSIGGASNGGTGSNFGSQASSSTGEAINSPQPGDAAGILQSPGGTTPQQSVVSQCRNFLPLMLSAGEGFASPEAMEPLVEIRRRLLPMTCQDVGTLPLRMCCPGKIKNPTSWDMVLTRGVAK